MKKLLAIDTSTDKASIALAVSGQIFTKTNSNIKQHAEFLLPMISELLHEANISLQDLEGIVFGCGPGSFTGIRVTCSVAKALAYAHNLPLYPVTSLQAIAYAAGAGDFAENVAVLALLDARMQEFYWQYFTNLQGGAPEVSSLQNIKIPEVSSLIIAGPNVKSVIDVNINCSQTIEFFENSTTSFRSSLVEIKDIFPMAQNMLKLVQDNYIEAVTVKDAAPLYVRNKVVSGGVNG